MEVGCATVVTVFVNSVVTAPSDATSSAGDPGMFGGFVELNVYR